MIEKQLKSYPHYRPSRERLAYLLAQLAELDPEPVRRLNLEPVPARKANLEPVPINKLNLEPAPASKPVARPASKPQSKKKPAKSQEPARKPARKLKPEPGRVSKTKPEREPDSNMFHAVLQESARMLADRDSSQQRDSNLRPWLQLNQGGPLSGLARIWSWLQSKYTKSANRRLKLSEVVSLGDKRFVALVKVEDREFLVAGAASGLSLLAQLGNSSEPVKRRKRGIGVEGRSH